VAGDGELEHVVGGCRDALLSEQQVVDEKDGESWRELVRLVIFIKRRRVFNRTFLSAASRPHFSTTSFSTSDHFDASTMSA